MSSAVVARLSWGVLVAPLAALFLMVSLLMWPLVLQNNAARLALIAYVIGCPLLPLFWRGSRVASIVCAGALALILQVVAVGIVDFWF